MGISSSINLSGEPVINEKGEEIFSSDCENSIELFLDVLKKGDFFYSKQHFHPSLQVNFVYQGTLMIQVDEKIYEIREGNGILINANTLHCLNPGGLSDCITYSFNIYPHAICSEKDMVSYNRYITPIVNNFLFSHIILQRSVDWQDTILNLLHQTFTAVNQDQPAHELIAKRNIIDIWIILLKHYSQYIQKNLSPYKQTQTIRLKTMIAFIHTHYNEKISLNQIANYASISISECNRCFKNVLNQSPIDYVKQVRITEACRYLSTTSHSIQEISDLTGFSNIPYFYRVFSSMMGITPKEYRESVTK